MRGPEEWPSSGSNPVDRIRLTVPAALILSPRLRALARWHVSARERSLPELARGGIPGPELCPEIHADCAGAWGFALRLPVLRGFRSRGYASGSGLRWSGCFLH